MKKILALRLVTNMIGVSRYLRFTIIILILLDSLFGICQVTENDAELIKQYESLTTQIDSLNFVMDSISKRSDSIYRSIVDPQKTILKIDYDQIRQNIGGFNEKYRNLISSNNFPFTLPIAFEDLSLIVGYGEKYHPITRTKVFHKGIDFPSEKGQPVTSTISGYVELAEIKSTYGKHVIIGSESGIKIHFAHLDSIFIKKGDRIIIGQQIGEVGNTGLSTRYHLHYEISINDELINPLFTFFNVLTEKDIKFIFGNNDQSFD